MAEVAHFLEPIPWFAWIPIVAILGGIASGTLTRLVAIKHRHTERMAMIERGLHPDARLAMPAADEAMNRTKPVGIQEI